MRYLVLLAALLPLNVLAFGFFNYIVTETRSTKGFLGIGQEQPKIDSKSIYINGAIRAAYDKSGVLLMMEDLKNDLLVIVEPEKQRYIETRFKDFLEQIESNPADPSPEIRLKYRKLQHTKYIMGEDCSLYDVRGTMLFAPQNGSKVTVNIEGEECWRKAAPVEIMSIEQLHSQWVNRNFPDSTHNGRR